MYGKWFREAVKAGRLKPVSVGVGRNGRRQYAVRDILALRAEDAARSDIHTKLLMSNN